MSKEKEDRKIFEGCAVSRFCDDPCKSLHKKVYNPATKETLQCPSYYRYYMEKKKIDTESFKKKKEKWIKIELR